jgi:hypothetical protein
MKVYIMRGKSESIPGVFHVINSCGAQELIIKSVTIRDFWCDFSESCRCILVARSQHGDFAAYHERFNHDMLYSIAHAGGQSPLHTFIFVKIIPHKS